MGNPAKRTKPAHTAGPLRKLAGAGQDAAKLDQLIHERARLGIVSALAANETLGFPELRDLLGLTDGNLAVHARKLEEAGYVACEKSFRGRIPRTEFSLTPAGRKALAEYLERMESLIRAARTPPKG